MIRQDYSMNFEEAQELKKLIRYLDIAAYNSGCADEHPQQSWKQQDKWASKTRETRQEIFNKIDSLVEKH